MRYVALVLVVLVFGCRSIPDVSVSHSDMPEWEARCTQAKLLAGERSSESFQQLLALLADPHADVSYAAATALGKRSQMEFVEDLLEVCRRLPAEHKWFAFSMLKHYPNRDVLLFLSKSLEDEFGRSTMDLAEFDDTNYFYIMTSIEAIVDTLTGAYPIIDQIPE